MSLLLWLVALATPAQTLLQQTRCRDQVQLEHIVARCTKMLSPGFVPTPPPKVERRVAGWSQSTLGVGSAAQFVEGLASAGIDSYMLAEQLGEPTLHDGWFRFPVGVQTENGRCAIAVRAPGEIAPLLRYETTRGPAMPFEPDARCPALKDQRLLARLCTDVWIEDSQFPDYQGQPVSSPATGVTFERLPFGMRARFSTARISPVQLATVYGVGKRDGPRWTYDVPPPLTRIGRRCQAEARFSDRGLTQIEVWRAPAYAGSPDAGARMPPQAEQTLARIDHQCAAGPSSSLGVFDASTLRLAHLYQRYGAATLTRVRDDDYVDFDRFLGRHRFSLSGGRCTLEVDVSDPMLALRIARLSWAGP
ncbi:MAG: hypothetical protein ACI9U2_005067 [Bradymonadia bacterium]|jgi:hypothetical protein